VRSLEVQFPGRHALDRVGSRAGGFSGFENKGQPMEDASLTEDHDAAEAVLFFALIVYARAQTCLRSIRKNNPGPVIPIKDMNADAIEQMQCLNVVKRLMKPPFDAMPSADLRDAAALAAELEALILSEDAN
jgi:hypothetical protein